MGQKKVCEIIGISKIEFFNFSDTKQIKQNQKKKKQKRKEIKIKTICNLLSLQVNLSSSSFKKRRTFFLFFTENLN